MVKGNMATELTELVDLANENILREQANRALQTDLDSWTERLELEQALANATAEIDIASEPNHKDWDGEVVSFGNHVVLGFLVRKGPTDERTVFS